MLTESGALVASRNRKPVVRGKNRPSGHGALDFFFPLRCAVPGGGGCGIVPK